MSLRVSSQNSNQFFASATQFASNKPTPSTAPATRGDKVLYVAQATIEKPAEKKEVTDIDRLIAEANSVLGLKSKDSAEYKVKVNRLQELTTKLLKANKNEESKTLEILIRILGEYPAMNDVYFTHVDLALAKAA